MTTIKLKRSDVPGKVPLPGDLELGELALNTADGNLFLKKNDGTVESVGDAMLRQDLSDPDKGAAMVARGVVAVDSIADLLALPEGQRKEGLRYLVKGYYVGSDVGGGEFYWDASKERSAADGGMVIDPTSIGGFSGGVHELESYLAAQGDGVGQGCFVRLNSSYDIREYGAVHSPKEIMDQGIGVPVNMCIKNCLSSHNTVHIPKGNFLIDITGSRGIEPPDNSIIICADGATLYTNNSNLSRYYIVNLESRKNITIKGGVYIGDRHLNTVQGGEHGMGFYLQNSENIVIEDVIVQDCWGDGIYVGGGEYSASKNIRLSRVLSKNNRRQGLSIISVDGLLVEDSEFSDTNGTSPNSGIDIEPNFSTQSLKNILIRDCRFRNNAYAALLIYLVSYQDNGVTHDIGIRAERCYMEDTGLQIIGKETVDESFNGYLHFATLHIKNASTNSIQVRGTPESLGDILVIDSPVLDGWNKAGINSESAKAAIHMGYLPPAEGTTYSGYLRNPVVFNTLDAPAIRYVAVPYAVLEQPPATPALSSSNVRMVDPYEKARYTLNFSSVQVSRRKVSTYVNTRSDSNVQTDLGSGSLIEGDAVTFRKLAPDSFWTLVPEEGTMLYYGDRRLSSIRLRDEGEYVVLKRINGTTISVIDISKAHLLDSTP